MNTPRSPADRRGLSWTLAAGAVGVMFLWALCFPLIRVGLEAAPPIQFAALRAIIAGAVLLLAARLFKRPPARGRSAWGGIVVVALSATTLGFAGMFYGGSRISPGLATVIANTQPLIAALLAALWLEERLNRRQHLGLLTGFLGIVVIAAPGVASSSTFVQGVFFILLGAVGVAVGNVALKRLAGGVDVLWAMGWQLAIGGIVLFACGVVLEPWGVISWSADLVLALSALSVIGTSLPFVWWFCLLSRAPLSQLNAWTFLTPIFGLAIGLVFFDEKLGVWALVGTALCLLGIRWVNQPNPRSSSLLMVLRGAEP